ncbi:MAG: hypothetical protein E7287_03280 [Lachnospiraceae bacterium]|nr:hypothetical protein [Lachnospiraceae bacterium]
MKKFLALLCMITCIFGLTACGEEKELSEYETWKLSAAEEYVEQNVIPMFCELSNQPSVKAELIEYTAEEIEYAFEAQSGILVEGNAMIKALDSFKAALDTIGAVTAIEEVTAKADGKQMIITATVTGDKKSAEAEIILSNDAFMVLESAALNPITSTGELMGKAAMNTLLGMGSVFTVLVLIIIVISSFSLISKIQNAKQKKEKNSAQTGIDNAVAQIVEQEESAATDDTELVAVIAAAIAAYEGSASTDGFVVRSIRKRNR